MQPLLRRSAWMAACGMCLALPAQAGQNIVTGIDVATSALHAGVVPVGLRDFVIE
jgi:hypothetical protein